MFGMAPFIKPTPAMFIAGDNSRPSESQISEKIHLKKMKGRPRSYVTLERMVDLYHCRPRLN